MHGQQNIKKKEQVVNLLDRGVHFVVVSELFTQFSANLLVCLRTGTPL